jgi:hypothetical protein
MSETNKLVSLGTTAAIIHDQDYLDSTSPAERRMHREMADHLAEDLTENGIEITADVLQSTVMGAMFQAMLPPENNPLAPFASIFDELGEGQVHSLVVLTIGYLAADLLNGERIEP